MTVYVGAAEWPYRGQKYCHMFADTLEELHAMADRVGMKRQWFQGPNNKSAKYPHYDLAPSKRSAAVAFGAVEANHRMEIEAAKKLLAEYHAQASKTN